MKKLILCIIASMSMLKAGRYPLQNDILNIPDATDLAARVGACPGGMQGVLIAPRIIATVSHGGLQASVETQEPITINGQRYTIIRKVEDGNLHYRDLTLCFLDRPVEDIVIPPVLQLTVGQTIPTNSRLHAISIVSSNIMLDRRFEPGVSLDTPPNDAEHALPYGINIPHYGALNNSSFHRYNFNNLSVNNNGPTSFQFIPTGGDSGSPCFVSTNDNRLATVGVVSTVGYENQGIRESYTGITASYTYIGMHLDWVRLVIQRHYGHENQTDFTINTIDAHSCNFNPHPLVFETVRQRVEDLRENDPTVKINYFEELQNQLPVLEEALQNDPHDEYKKWIVHQTKHTISRLESSVYEAIRSILPVLKNISENDPENVHKAWIVHHRSSQLNALRPLILEKLEKELDDIVWARDNELNQSEERQAFLQWMPNELRAKIAQLRSQLN
jgi:hypothetical protein